MTRTEAPSPPTGPARIPPPRSANTRAAYFAWRTSVDGRTAWEAIQRLALQQSALHSRLSVNALVEAVRATYRVEINNTYRAWLADDLVTRYPTLVEKIERRVRRPKLAVRATLAHLGGVRIPEAQVQRDVVRLYEQFGCLVYSLSQPRETMQTPGIPDLYVFNRRVRVAWWHETKAVDGKLSDDQLTFMAACQLCGAGHVVGGLDAAKAKLTELKLIAAIGGGG